MPYLYKEKTSHVFNQASLKFEIYSLQCSGSTTCRNKSWNKIKNRREISYDKSMKIHMAAVKSVDCGY